MNRYRAIRLATILAIAALSMLPTRVGFSLTIRHDKSDADYINLSTNSKWAAAGVFTANSTCPTSGGTLIHPEWAITAAHCANATADFILGPDRIDVDEQVSIASRTLNPGYAGVGSVGNGRDLGLLRLDSPILSVTPVRLHRTSQELTATTTVIGYGHSGTGITGDNGAHGTRRAGQNVIDAFGNTVISGVSFRTAIIDFDSPTSTQNSTGSANSLDFEAGIALFDSGSGWFIDVNGRTELAAVTSFEAAADGNANSSYTDLGGGTRISQNLTWIDDTSDSTHFWNQTVGNWNTASRWDIGAQPGALNAAVVDGGRATITDAGEIAKYTFVVGSGELVLRNSIASSELLLREGGHLQVANVAGATTLTGNLQQESDGTLELNVRTGNTLGSGYDRLIVTGDAAIDGTFEVSGAAGSDPDARGTAEDFIFLTATNLVGQFDSIKYDGVPLTVNSRTYVGESNNGDDGMFRLVEYNGDNLVLQNFLALPGDANGDGLVDGVDFAIWSANKFTSGKDWADGDFDGDGNVGGSDFLIWNQFKSSTAATANLSAVPEPTGLLLIVLPILFFWRRVKTQMPAS